MKALPRRVAHAVHALMELRNDVNIGPYGPFKVSEIVLYDGEAPTAAATYQALRRAMRYGLTVYVGHGLWTPTSLALDNCRAFEDRYAEDTALHGSIPIKITGAMSKRDHGPILWKLDEATGRGHG